MTGAALAEKAVRIQAVVEEHTVQAHGMLPMFVRASDYQLPTAEDYAGAYHHRHLHGQTEADIGIAPMHVWRAWQATGDAKFLREVERWYVACDPSTRFEVPTGKITAGGLGWRDLYLPALLMELDPTQHEVWRSLMLRPYRTLRTGVLDDGTSPLQWTYDSGTGEREVPGRIVGGEPARTGRSANLAKGCVSAQRWLPDEDMVATARTILEGLDLDTFRFVMPLDEAQPLPAEWHVETQLLDHDSLTPWLWAYWEGRWRGYW